MEELFESSAIAHLVEKQWKKWLALTAPHVEGPARTFPTVTISRERGSGGSVIAKEVAERLGFVLFDSQLVDHVARAAAVDRIVVAHMDERSQRSIKEWTERVIQRQAFSPQSYMGHLTKTILTAGEKGKAVILGRGAHLLLPPSRCLRVRVIAPLAVRVNRVAAATGVPREEAEDLIEQTDRQRAAFIRDNYRESDADPRLYDLVINTGEMSLQTAADLIIQVVQARFPEIREAATEAAGNLASAGR